MVQQERIAQYHEHPINRRWTAPGVRVGVQMTAALHGEQPTCGCVQVLRESKVAVSHTTSLPSSPALTTRVAMFDEKATASTESSCPAAAWEA